MSTIINMLVQYHGMLLVWDDSCTKNCRFCFRGFTLFNNKGVTLIWRKLFLIIKYPLVSAENLYRVIGETNVNILCLISFNIKFNSGILGIPNTYVELCHSLQKRKNSHSQHNFIRFLVIITASPQKNQVFISRQYV